MKLLEYTAGSEFTPGSIIMSFREEYRIVLAIKPENPYVRLELLTWDGTYSPLINDPTKTFEVTWKAF